MSSTQAARSFSAPERLLSGPLTLASSGRLLHLQAQIRGELAKLLHHARGPANLDACLAIFAKPEMHRQVAARGIPHAIGHRARLRPARRFARHLRPHRGMIALLPFQPSKERLRRFRNTSYVSFFSPVITRSSRPSPSTSPKSAPIPERLRPSPLYATPDSVAISWKPSPVDRKSKLRALSLATNKPGRASPRKSAMATPMPLPSTSGNPSLAIISVNVPSPLLWKSCIGSAR